MSVSPYVKFNFQNNNVMETTPLMGVSCILTRTTKGPFNDPSKVITSYAQFQREFGEEICPDGTVSNVKKALELGSKLRIIKVLGQVAEEGQYGFYGTLDNLEEKGESSPSMKLLAVNGKNLNVKIKYIGQESDKFRISLKSNTSENGVSTLKYEIYDLNSEDLVETNTLISFKNAVEGSDQPGRPSRDLPAQVDYQALSDALDNSVYLKPEDDAEFEKILSDLRVLDQSTNKSLPISIISKGTENNYFIPQYEVTPAISGEGGISDTQTIINCWVKAVNTLLDYTDVYQVGCSFLNEAMLDPSGVRNDELIRQIHAAIADVLVPLQEYTYYIEVPKSLEDYEKINAWVTPTLGAVGNSKYIAFFAGGIKYYSDSGRLQGCDILGTIMGLGDTSASNYGPWKSFAGMNRGVIWDGNGPVCPNYGSPSQYEYLNLLAQNYVNMIVVKDTASSGKQTMLWHLFTSQIKQDSERFLSIVRLNLYLKKTLRPILENYLEEPNTWGTWKNIWLRVKPILDNLIDQQAMTEYTWMGDQNATSYNDLTVNNEADVRQGKYKVVLKYKDVVPMQEIIINITIDAASQTVNINSDNE